MTKYPINLSLYFLVLLALLLELTLAGNTASQSRQSAGVRMSPETWPPGELEKYWRLQRDYERPHPAVESARGMVAVTSDAFSARIGLEALQQGGSAADAALATSLAQIALEAGAPTSYAGILTMVYYDAPSKKVYSLNAGYNTVLEEKDPLTIPGEVSLADARLSCPDFLPECRRRTTGSVNFLSQACLTRPSMLFDNLPVTDSRIRHDL